MIAVKHQKVTKTLNHVINSSMQHKLLMAYVRIYTQQCIFFYKWSSDHQNDNFETFSRLSMLLIAARTNTNSCQAWILVNFTNVAPAHSSIQYRQMFWYHLIEETFSYPHVWTFPENILKYLYGGTFEKCKLFFETHCIVGTLTPVEAWKIILLPSAGSPLLTPWGPHHQHPWPSDAPLHSSLHPCLYPPQGHARAAWPLRCLEWSPGGRRFASLRWRQV